MVKTRNDHIRKVKGALALASAGASPGEREAARYTAKCLIERYHITREELGQRSVNAQTTEARQKQTPQYKRAKYQHPWRIFVRGVILFVLSSTTLIGLMWYLVENFAY